MKVRLVVPDEFEELGRLTVRAYRVLYGGESLGSYEDELRDVATRQRDCEVYVALDDDGTVLGGVAYVPNASGPMSEFDDPHAAGIRMLAVDPAAQGMGVGRRLVESCIDRARLHQRRRVILHSTPLMTIARGLYERLGFVATPDLDIWFRDETHGDGEPFHLIAYTLAL